MKRFGQLCAAVAVVFALTSSAVLAQSSSTPAGAAADKAAVSSVPRSVPFNGQVVRAASGDKQKAVADSATVMLTFGLYTDQTDGTPLWTEQQVVSLDQDGRYSAILGSASADGLPADAFAAAKPKWLGVTVEGEKEQPRFMLLSVPYALKAGDAETIAGKPATDFVMSEKLTESVKSTLKEEGYAPKSTNNPEVSTAGKIPKFSDAVNNTVDSIMLEQGGKIGVNNPTINWFAYQTFRLDNSAAQGSGFTVAATVPGGHFYTLVSTGPAAGTGAGYLTVYDEGVGQFRMVIAPNGNVGIGTANPTQLLDVNGSVNVTGNIAAKYQDVAEWVDTPEPMEAGTVVIVDPNEPNRVVPSAKAYDTRVAGAVSRQPGLVLGEKADSKEMVAQSGRVRIKVDAKYGAIKIGDLLVTSPTPGYAMKSKAMKVGDSYLHRPGTLLGKALEPMPNGKGEILVLLTLQ